MTYNYKTIFATLAIILSALIGFNWWVDEDNSFTCETTPHLVKTGDTLWGIAEAKCEGNIESVMTDVVRYYGKVINEGDVVYLPTNQDCLLSFNDGQVYEDCQP